MSARRTPSQRLCAWGQNLALACASLLIFFLFCELVLFRSVLPATDVPEIAFVDDVIRYAPNQTGVTRIRAEIEAPYAINQQGWNSGIPSYRERRTPDTGRIAIIGDSYVEGFQVPFDASLAELTQAGLQGRGCPTEVYRFGLSGAPFSQYLHMLEHEVVKYRPDWAVVVLVHNDFTDSFQIKPGRYRSSFMKLKIEGGRVIDELPPQPYQTGLLDWLGGLATVRYFHYNWRFQPRFIRDLLLGSPARHYEANIDVDDTVQRLGEIRIATDYLLGRMAAVAAAQGTKLLVVMDGHRHAIYGEAKEDWSTGPLALNALVKELTAARGVPFIDLHPRFARDWAEHHRRFGFPKDSHWNATGHRLVADVLVDYFAPRCGEPNVRVS
jgi:hypothetical protein